MSDVLEGLISRHVATTLRRYDELDRSGVLDPEYSRTRFVSPRFQEACLTLALAAGRDSMIPEGRSRDTLREAAVAAADVWLRLTDRSGGVHPQPDGPLDAQATAYGVYAVARTLVLLGGDVPSTLRTRAERRLRRSARYLARVPVPPGIETRPLRAAALASAAEWLANPGISISARTVRREGARVIRQMLDSPETSQLDAGGLALAFAFLTVTATEKQRESELDLWRDISLQANLSTAPNGFFGGGAESSVASLPIPTGFTLASRYLPEAARMMELLRRGWEQEVYNGLLDPDVPWLTPMSHLALTGLAHWSQPQNGEGGEEADPSALHRVDDVGGGRIHLGEWLLRLAGGATMGWLHHVPSGSTRLFGSPAGVALREGPWIIEGTRLRHPALAGRFEVGTDDESLRIAGELPSIPIPGTERSPRRIGFPRLGSRRQGSTTRLVPFRRIRSMRTHGAPAYERTIELKEGALTIETLVEGRIMHRIPMIWPGGLFGDILVDKRRIPINRPLQERRVKEIIFEGGPWPAWLLRFDRPVDLLYEPLHGPVTLSPLRYLTAAAGSFDIIAEDRLHMAWRVG